MRQLIYSVLLFFCAGLLLPAIVAGQETSGSLTGRVLNEKNEPLAGASIVAVHTPSGTKYSAMAGNDGRYLIPGMRVGGPYKIEISMVGLATQVQDNISIKLGEPLQLNVVLTAANNELTAVTVKAARKTSPKANTYGAGQNISSLQVSNMPTIARSITDITKLVPQGSKDNSFAGTNFRYNNVTIDGAINNDAIGFSPSLGGVTGASGMPGSSTRTNPISLDAIEDLQVYLAPFDVKIGNFTGGSINAVTKSGTNKVTGSVYGFGRNASVTAKDKAGSLGKMSSDFYDYQAGVRLGFPIIRNKLFFFTNAELTRRQDPVQLMAGTPETAAILSVEDANAIREITLQRYGKDFDPGTAGAYNTWSRSVKFFNRLDWNINAKHQLSIRNNTIRSEAVYMDRDQQDFRFSSMAFQQTNNQSSTVAELRSRFTNRLSNSLIIGYSAVHDYRDPLSNPALPQVQIMGRQPGTTIYLGTDREASIFDMKQKTLEITDNITLYRGKHNFLFGTHNELYDISYGFVNSWNGRVDYLSINDYLQNIPYRVRGNFNFDNNDRDYIQSNPEAKFKLGMLSVYAQDEIQVTDKLKITPGIRADYTLLPDKPILSDATTQAMTDGFFGNTYTYTPLSRIRNEYFGRVQVSPRLGFRYNWLGDESLVLRGGIGLFTGRIPFAWVAYAYYNNGYSYGSFDQRADSKAFVPGTDPLKPGKNGIADFIAQNGNVIDDRNAGKTQIDVIDNDFVMPQVMRTSIAMDYTTANGYKFTLEGIYTKSLKDVQFKQVNIKDDPRYYGYDPGHQQLVYSGNTDPHFANAYQLSNTNQGYRYSITASMQKNFPFGLSAFAAYTYGQSKDISNGIRNSMESNWQLNQALNPNDPQLEYSNFDIRHRIVANISYRKIWNAHWRTNMSLFMNAQAGTPFTYGIVNNSIQGLPQQVSLAYIPQREEAIRFFQDYTTEAGTMITAATQAASFNSLIDNDKYLSSRRGQFTERNKGRTPWNTQADLRIAQEYHFGKSAGSHFLTITLDVINLTNLLNPSWGRVYFSPNTFNSTSSVGLTPVYPARQNPGNYPVFTFNKPQEAYAIDFFNSRCQLQLGLRYSF